MKSRNFTSKNQSVNWLFLCILSASLFAPWDHAQADDDIRNLKLKDWAPRSMLIVKSTMVERSKFPAIDVHNHLGTGSALLSAERVASYLEEMNQAGVKTVVNLDGAW